MELKKYQKSVIKDLCDYLCYWRKTSDPSVAYNKLWESKGINIGYAGRPNYINSLESIPSVCIKIPTGGGKTFIGISALKSIFESMPLGKMKVVVWLVPWDTILSQTFNSLSSSNHFYRQTLNKDFLGEVGIYSKQNLLDGNNFTLQNIQDQLSIVLLSYDSIRTKEESSRKVFDSNPALSSFSTLIKEKNIKSDTPDYPSVMDVLRSLKPIIVIDESHNAESDLSIQMIKDLNPSFVFEMTATPKKHSNVISIISALELKKEEMIKLPVLATNLNSIDNVITSAIDLQSALELKASKEKNHYIRPIVLFQAQPKNTSDVFTFDKIKKLLTHFGIPEEQIAIKTAKKDEIKNIDLMSKECKIRFIITINALKEGWDCPFAYILASIANKNSYVDVEQLLGRILRQPYQKYFNDRSLNMSYVFSSSNNFQENINKIIKGLNYAGLGEGDLITENNEGIPSKNESGTEQVQTTLENYINNPDSDDDILDKLDPSIFKPDITSNGNSEIKNSETDKLLCKAINEGEKYDKKIEKLLDTDIHAPEIDKHMKFFFFSNDVKSFADHLLLPKFVTTRNDTLFMTQKEVEKEELDDGFDINAEALPSNIIRNDNAVYQIDVDEEQNKVKQSLLDQENSKLFKEMLEHVPEETRINKCKDKLEKDLSQEFKNINRSSLKSYIGRFIEKLAKNDLEYLKDNIATVELQLISDIRIKLLSYRKRNFKELLEKGNITVDKTFKFPKTIHPLDNINSLRKTLYEAESSKLNTIEMDFAVKISSLENVLCWHRIDEKFKEDYFLNGYINHYPDFIIFTKKGMTILIETKGEFIGQNNDTRDKLELGKLWEKYSGFQNYRYYIGFPNTDPLELDGTNTIDKLIEVIKTL